MIPKYTPNPNVLGEVRCSYGKATPTQNNLRNKRDKSRKQTRRSSIRECMIELTGWSDVYKIEHVDWTGEKEPAAQEKTTPVNPMSSTKKHRCSCLERLQNGPTEHRLNRQNQIQNTGVVVQRDPKTNYSLHRFIRRRWTSIRRCNE